MIDNGSSDGTQDFLKDFVNKYSNFSLILNDSNLGVIGGRNQGFIFSKNNRTDISKYIMHLDNDQFVKRGWLEQHVYFLESNDYDLVGVEAWQMNSRFMPIKKICDKKEHFTYVGCGGMLIKNKVVDDIGIFDNIFNPSYFEDPDLNIRANIKGYKIGWNADAKIVHMPHRTLGKLSQAEKSRRFTNSLMKFREKWRGHKLNRLWYKNT